MRRARRKRVQYNVSLFPFLAVLICTLGVLIVMLVVAAKQADVTAQQEKASVAAEKERSIEQLKQKVEAAEIRIRGISKMRPKLLAKLDHSRQNRSHLNEQIRELRKKLRAANDELSIAEAALNQKLTTTNSSDLVLLDQAAIDQLKDKIKQTEQEIDDIRSSIPPTGPNRYGIVPYRGEGGTFRRPIFIECLKEEVVMQPFGIRLKKSEFELPLEAGNMVDAALLTIREYWQRFDLAGDQGSPYPLIVVRPDAAETFVLARRAMKSWDDEFGYELVEADKEIDYGELDPKLADEVKAAIEKAREIQFARSVRRKRIARHRAQFASTQSSPGLGVSGAGGGFERINEGVGTSVVANRSAKNGANALRQLKAGLKAGSGKSDPTQRNASLFQEAGAGDNSRVVSASLDRLAGTESANPSSKSLGASATDASGSKGKTRSGAKTNGTGGNATSEGDGTGAGANASLSLAQTRGAGWALPTRTEGAIGYLRPLRIVCYPDRLELVRPNGAPKVIRMSKETKLTVDEMVESIWKQVDSWGIAGPNSYWKPQLRFTVTEGAQSRFNEIRGLLFNSGLVIEPPKSTTTLPSNTRGK